MEAFLHRGCWCLTRVASPHRGTEARNAEPNGHKGWRDRVPELSHGKICGDWHGARPALLHRIWGQRQGTLNPRGTRAGGTECQSFNAVKIVGTGTSSQSQ
ncbi:hypothetical protein AS29_011330 [Bacillus sp. SJS]|nr:hypothetical protein AS29_011330 [Bacillus sp. SJS]